MTRGDQSAIVLTVVGVGASAAGASLLWGAGAGLLLFGLLVLFVAYLLGQA